MTDTKNEHPDEGGCSFDVATEAGNGSLLGPAMTSETHVSQLPDECLLLIFEQLSMYQKLVARQVCIKWYHLLEDSIRRGPSVELKISHQVELSPCGQPDTGFKFFPIRQQFTCAELSEYKSKVLSKYLHRVVRIEFSMVLIGANALVTLINECPRVETLIVHECNLNRCINELEAAVRLMQDRIRVLSLESNMRLNASGLLLMEAPRLEFLNLKRTVIDSRYYEQASLFGPCTHTIQLSISEPPLKAIEKIVERSGQRLEHLELDDDHNVGQWTIFEPQSCMSRLLHLTKLKTLTIGTGICDFVSDLSNATVAQLLKSNPGLTSLSICPRYRDTHSMTGQLLIMLPKLTPNLRHLKLTNMSDLTAQRVAQLRYLVHLETCTLDACFISWEFSVEEVQLFAEPIIGCPQLRSISFRCLNPVRDNLFWGLIEEQFAQSTDPRLKTFQLIRDRLDLSRSRNVHNARELRPVDGDGYDNDF